MSACELSRALVCGSRHAGAGYEGDGAACHALQRASASCGRDAEHSIDRPHGVCLNSVCPMPVSAAGGGGFRVRLWCGARAEWVVGCNRRRQLSTRRRSRLLKYTATSNNRFAPCFRLFSQRQRPCHFAGAIVSDPDCMCSRACMRACVCMTPPLRNHSNTDPSRRSRCHGNGSRCSPQGQSCPPPCSSRRQLRSSRP